MSAPMWMITFNYLMGHILYQVFKITLSILKKHETMTDNLIIKVSINKIENKTIFKIKTRYRLKVLTPKTMKLLENTENKITKGENCENVPYVETTEVILVFCNTVNND